MAKFLGDVFQGAVFDIFKANVCVMLAFSHVYEFEDVWVVEIF